MAINSINSYTSNTAAATTAKAYSKAAKQP